MVRSSEQERQLHRDRMATVDVADESRIWGPRGLASSGASYPIAAGLFKNLPGAVAIGYDGVDNNGNGLVDEIGEGRGTALLVQQNHTHVTARAEMLYAILVEGSGPWGSVFNRDDFTDREVRDTDGDGLPEFVDAWGQPLQFFRWPVLYHSDLQRGQVILPDPNIVAGVTYSDLLPPYQTVNPVPLVSNFDTSGSIFRERERDTLDPNQQLTAPQWWSTAGVGGQLATNDVGPFGNTLWPPAHAIGGSGGVQAFEYFFHRLTEPVGMTASSPLYWDRSGNSPRRAFYSKFLILSGGRDKKPGVFLYATRTLPIWGGLGLSPSSCLIANENNALPFALDVFFGQWPAWRVRSRASRIRVVAFFSDRWEWATPVFPAATSNDPLHPSSYDLQQSAADDISNHNLQAVSGIGGSG